MRQIWIALQLCGTRAATGSATGARPAESVVASDGGIATGKDAKISPAVVAVASKAKVAAIMFRMLFTVNPPGIMTMHPEQCRNRARAAREAYLVVSP